MPTPHDALFKSIFSRRTDAEGELRAVLPPALVTRIDWTTLRRLPATLSDPTDAERHADLLFAARIAGRQLLLHLVLELESRADRWTALQVHGYAVRIWQEHRRRHPGSRWLPAVVSVVVHHGTREWREHTDLIDLFDLDATTRRLLEPHLPRVRFVLDDLSTQSDAALLSRTYSSVGRLGLACLHRVARGGDPEEILHGLRDLFDAVLAEPSPGARLVAVLSYLAKVWDLDAENLRSIVHRELGPDTERVMTSTYDRLVNQGREEGRAEGHAEGRAHFLLELLEERFGPLDPRTVALVRAADLDSLRLWARRILTAGSLDDIFT